MIKVRVTREDVHMASSFLTKQPGADTALHDPVAQSLKRLVSADPRWRRPYIGVDEVKFRPRSKYHSLRPFSVSLPKSARKYCTKFDVWASNRFVGSGPGVIEFSLKGVRIDQNGRVQR